MSATHMPTPIITEVKDEDVFISDEKAEKNRKDLLNYWTCVQTNKRIFSHITEVRYVFYSAKVAGDDRAPDRFISNEELMSKVRDIVTKRLMVKEQKCDGTKGNWNNGIFGSRWLDLSLRKDGLTVRISFDKREKREQDEKPYVLSFTFEELPYFSCENPNCSVYSNNMKKCGKCKSARYCGQDCQKSHWREHKKTCGVEIEDSDEEEVM